MSVIDLFIEFVFLRCEQKHYKVHTVKYLSSIETNKNFYLIKDKKDSFTAWSRIISIPYVWLDRVSIYYVAEPEIKKFFYLKFRQSIDVLVPRKSYAYLTNGPTISYNQAICVHLKSTLTTFNFTKSTVSYLILVQIQ